jgi:hypothetical protein
MKTLGVFARHLAAVLLIGFIEVANADLSDRFFSNGLPGELLSQQFIQRGRCQSLIVIAPNMIAYIWVSKGKWTDMYLLWSEADRALLLSLIAGLDLNQIHLNYDVPVPNGYAGNHTQADRLQEALSQAVEEARLKGEFQCPIGA